MTETRQEAVVERILHAPRSLVWALVADTNRWDRAQGLSPANYRYRDIAGRRSRVAHARELGFEIEWVEPPYEWVEGRHVRGMRVFLKGPIANAGFHAYLADAPGGTQVTVTAFTAATQLVGRAVGQILKVKQRAAVERYLDVLETLLQGANAPDSGTHNLQAPAVTLARRSLFQSPYGALTSGPRSSTNVAELVRRSAIMRSAGLDGAHVDLLIALMRDRPDEELSQIRPFELASLWGIDRKAALRLFLHATHAGVVDLKWQINCPVCRVGAAVADHMTEIGRESHCDACNIDYGVDLAKHVEAVFQCNAAIRRVENQLYCASSPSFLPHVTAQVRALAGSTTTERIDLASMIHIRTLEGKHALDLAFDELPRELRVTISDTEITASGHGTTTDGATAVVVESRAASTMTLLIERSGWSADIVLGSVIATFPEFVQFFATEAPATGVELTVSHIALLFTDLTGSTACYERLGDARAFALVQAHFVEMGECIANETGALVKTMGDAVMASFAAPADAVRAGIAMIRANESTQSGDGLGVKVGVHAGPCLAVRANDRLDFFGTTANVAARVQAQAASGELVMAAALARDPAVKPLLEGLPQRQFQASLKGISAAVDLVGVQIGRADA
ncbi:MAG: hypothetical protein IPK60_00850 [Sandaracinaceae bacterium]|nr:hypothetical protein [Sandaracinaceae bacterium]